MIYLMRNISELEAHRQISAHHIATSIKSFKDFNKAEKEIRFIERYGIEPLFIK